MTMEVGAISFVTVRPSLRGDAIDVLVRNLDHSIIIGRRCSK